MTRSALPDVLLLMTDQQRYDSLGCYGCGAVDTPILDQLAAEGVRFDLCYVTNPICTPSRASLMTGHHLPRHGVYRLHGELASRHIMFPERLRRIGYRTALFGKLHAQAAATESHSRHPNDGFDIYEWHLGSGDFVDSPMSAYGRWLQTRDPRWYEHMRQHGKNVRHVPRDFHMTRWAADRTIEFLQSMPDDQPFFCMMSVFDPHNPYDDYPSELAERVNVDRIPTPVGLGHDLDCAPYAVRREHEASYFGGFSRFSRADLDQMRLGYYASIALMDEEVGRVLRTLERIGRAENTLVIFCSDHGDMLGDHQLLVKGAFFYDACVRVPLVLRWPAGFAGGMVVNGLVQLNDLAATILSAAGLSAAELAEAMPDAMDLLPLIRGETASVRDEVVCAYRNSGVMLGHEPFDPPLHGTMLRTDRYKLNLYHGPIERDNSPSGVEGQLFDMHVDPQETVNLWKSADHRDIRLELTERLTRWAFECDPLAGRYAAARDLSSPDAAQDSLVRCDNSRKNGSQSR